MPALSKPVERPEWATDGGADVMTPSGAKQVLGWISEKPPFQWFNWLHKWTYLWLIYFENVADRVDSQFDAVVGSGSACTHSTLEAAITAGAKNILVVNALTLTADVTINQNDTTIHFKPGATITKGGTATRGLILDARRIRVYDGRMLGFTAGPDIGVLLTANAKDCLVTGTMFQNATTLTISDLGSNNSLTNLIEEIA